MADRADAKNGEGTGKGNSTAAGQNRSGKGQPGGAASRPSAQPQDADGRDSKGRPQTRKRPDRLRDSGEQALARGIRQLEGLAQARRSGRMPSAEQEAGLRQEAYGHLDEGIRGTYGYNERTRPILSTVQKALNDPAQPVDESVVADLLQQLQRLRRELADADAPEAETAEPVSAIDPAQLPPAYRSSIQRYFEKLSKTR
jgi:hypothetical protein